MQHPFLDTPIEYLKSVGPQRAEMLKKELNIHNFADLLTFYPFRYVDRTKFDKINEINPDQAYVQLRGKITHAETAGSKFKKRFIVHFSDGKGSIELVWFQGIKWVQERLRYDKEYIVFGKPNAYKSKISIPHPEIEEVSEENTKLANALQPVYNTTEKLKIKGLDTKGIYKLQKSLVAGIQGKIIETLPPYVINKLRLISRENALINIHLPQNAELLKKAQLRLKFDELFYTQIKILRIRTGRILEQKGFLFETVGENFNSFYKNYLPFNLTNAQKRVIKEIRTDMGSGKQMNRLLQGDVGSGKTLVALMSMLISIDNGFQACIMAPTEILANQHFQTISELLKEMNLPVGLLTGSTKTAERKKLHELLQNGEIKILIGTHALIEDEVKFKNLGLVVIDEQHRFGVEQRSKLWKKNNNPPHVLVMTATPIPRTLAMTLYGDLDVSIIDEMPPGRKPIITTHRFESQRLRVFGFMKEQIKLGRQIYVVYPLIEESEKIDYKNLISGYESIIQEFPLPNYNVSIVHGKMKAADKELEMQRFLNKQTQIMVATSVIEVGVNVPNASVMVIESAERFGLSQLHQLRGRVGRGADQSYCILMTGYELGADTKTRIETMCRTNDGFEIADVDLKLRGPGDISGTQQSGVMDLKIADLAKDAAILQLARVTAQQVLDEDPKLSKNENQIIREIIDGDGKSKMNWSKIS